MSRIDYYTYVPSLGRMGSAGLLSRLSMHHRLTHPALGIVEPTWRFERSRPILKGVKSDQVKRAGGLLCRYEDGQRDFRGVSLVDVNLVGTDLREIDLSDADLRGANLLDADLRWAKLARADLTGAVLSMADLRGADLRATGLEHADLRMATYDASTRFPPSFSVTGAELTPQSGIVPRGDGSDVVDSLREKARRRRTGSQ